MKDKGRQDVDLKIVFITDLPVWSMGPGKGAPSFFNTLKAYCDRNFNVVLLTTERTTRIDSLESMTIRLLPKVPQAKFRGLAGMIRLLSKWLAYLLSQLIGVYHLARSAADADIVYAYEIGYVPAARLYAWFTGKPLVSRFQGTVLTPLLEGKGFSVRARLLVQFADHVWALKTKSDLTIMTDDGTRGDEVLSRLRRKDSRVEFWRNGIDQTVSDVLPEVKGVSAHTKGDILFASVSRLARWKRLDRSIEIFLGFHQKYSNSHYYICGSGPDTDRIKETISDLQLEGAVTLVGGVAAPVVRKVLAEATYFLSSYELSNLGNPMFEAIVSDAIVITIDNGDTSKLIVDGVTGLISPEANYLENVQKTINLHEDPAKKSRIRESAKAELARQFMTWEERMSRECEIVRALNHA